LLVLMATTAGIAFFAASAWLATAGNVTGVVVSWRNTTPISRMPLRPSRSGRNGRHDEQHGKA
jgi:hypothetical protein